MDIMGWMPEPDDHQLLAAFARTESEPAFAALVGRYVNLVYSTARRFTGNPHQAEEITQAVFIILARKAGKLSPRVVLSGWLYQAARLTSANLVKSEIRRRRREREAYMQSALNEPTDAAWQEIAPLLDEAMGRLGQTDRDAVVLRFFENKSAAEIGAVLRMNEETARRRVNRALEKLRKFFTKRGVSSTTAIIAGAISTNAIQAAPVALAKSMTAVAIAKSAAASASTLTLIEGALKIMAWTKAKTAVVTGIGVLLLAGTAVVGVKKIEVYRTDRDAWRVAGLTWPQVGATPPQVRILPTKFKPPVHNMQTCDGFRWGGIRVSVREILRASYRAAPGRVIFPGGEPQEKYDFISTLSRGTEEALQRELKNTLGFTGRWVTNDTDALALTVRNQDAPGLVPAFPIPDEYGDLPHGHIHCFGEGLSWSPPMPPWGLTKYLEMIFQKPVVDETGLTGAYNLDLRWTVKPNPQANQNAVKQALLDQLGLELVATNLPVEMLIVEKTK